MMLDETIGQLDTVQLWVATYGLRILAALALYVIGRYCAGLLKSVVVTTSRRARMDPNLVAFAGNVTYYGVLVFVLMAILGQLGIATASLLAVMGAAGLAVGLALQGSLSNFAAGLLLVFFHPFRVGDVIEGNGVTGVVEDIEVLTTLVRTPDNRLVTIPNSALTDNNLINLSRKGSLRIDMTICLDYSADIGWAKQLIAQILAGDTRVLTQPPPEVGVVELGEQGIVLAIRPWVATADAWPVQFATLEAIKTRFDVAQIRFAGGQVGDEDEHGEAPRLVDASNGLLAESQPAA